MSSPPDDLSLVGLIEDNFDAWQGTEQHKKLMAFYAPFRETLERRAEGFDYETMSWRDYRYGLWDGIPEFVEKPAIWDLVKADFDARDKLGESRYGTRLQPHNGRDALLDLYEERLDACVYARQAIYERDGK